MFIKSEIFFNEENEKMQRDYYGIDEDHINSILEYPYIEEGQEPEQQPTQLDNIEESQLIVMEAMADQYEQSVETELTNMEVMATIYEQLLAMEGAK